MPFVFQALKLHEQQRAVEGLDEGAALRFSAAAVNPDLWVRLRGVMDLEYDRRLRATLETDLRHERERRAARLGAMGPFGREQARGMEPLFVVGFDQAERDRARQFPQEFGPLQYRSRAWEALGMRVPTGDERNFVRTCFALVLAGPALWVVWAFLWRGGLSFRLAGIAVVRGDGRPASRWRGAWRALLAWGPVTGLLVASFWLEDSFWLAFAAGGGPGWQMTLALASWYAALGLLGVYAGLTLWWPARGPHDWLADTYLVPR